MVPNPFKKEAADSSPVVAKDEQPPALSAFLSPASKFVAVKASSKVLTPAEVAQKIATLLKPGPPFYSQVNNSDLIAHLADASIMNSDKLRAQVSAHAIKIAKKNGDVSTAAAEPVYVGTVWSALDGLPAGDSWGRIPGAPIAPEHANKSAGSAPSQNDDGLWNGLMLSCDLDCTDVTIERSVVIPTKVLKAHHYYSGNKQSLFNDIGAGDKYQWDDFNSFAQTSQVPPFHARILNLSPTVDLWSWPSWVPFLGKDEAKTPAAIAPGTPATGAPASPTTPTGSGVKRVWIPSTTKISVHAVWWGYTIYLPEAVFAELDGDVEEAQKVANLVNTVLTYLTNNIPSGLPLEFFAAITVLKAIAPVTGYISTFIGWSWSEIKSFDKGQGVQLSATWVLPVALIPRPWDAPTQQPAEPTDGSAPAAPGAPSDTPDAPAAPTTPAAPSAPSAPADSAPAAPTQPAPADPAPAAPAAPSEPAPAAPTDPAPAAPADPAPAAPAAPADPAPAEPIDSAPAAPAVPVDSTPEAPAAPVESAPDATAPATDAPAADAPVETAPVAEEPAVEDTPQSEAPADDPHLFDDCDSEDCEECAEERRKYLEEEAAWEARHPKALPPTSRKVVTVGPIVPAPGATLPPSPATDANDGLDELRNPSDTTGDAPQSTSGTGDSHGRADDSNPASQAPIGDSAPVAEDPNAVQDLAVDVPAPGATLPPFPATDANDGLDELRNPSDTTGDAPQSTSGTGDHLGRANDPNPDSQAPIGDSEPVADDPNAVEDLAVKGKKKIFGFGKKKASKTAL